MTKQLTASEIKKSILKCPGLYQTLSGAKFRGLPVSQVPRQLISCGWRNVSHLDKSDLKKLGLIVIEARYISGVRPKKFCDVVVARVGGI